MACIYTHIYIYINPPLKDGLTSSFGVDCHKYRPLAQSGVLNVVLFASPPSLFLLKCLHLAGVAWHLVRGRKSSQLPDEHFDVLSEGVFFWNVLFHIFSQNRLPKWPQNVTISSHLELQDDAMSSFCCIFENPVFERPYGDLNTFSNVGWSSKRKKACTNTLKTLVAAHSGETAFENTHGSKIDQKPIPIEVQMDDLATNSAPLFVSRCTLVRHMGPKSQKTIPRHPNFTKSSLNLHPIGKKSCKHSSKCHAKIM